MRWPDHGGNPSELLKLREVEREGGYIDFSANLNPLGKPSDLPFTDGVQEIDSYPDPDYKKTTAAVANHHDLPSSSVRLTNGGAEAIFLVAQLYAGKHALIIEPAFSEYERACKAHRLSITHVLSRDDASFSFPFEEVVASLADVDLVFLCRPNNPTGTVVPYATVVELVEAAAQQQTMVVIDEAFVHFLPLEVKGLTELLQRYSNIILLRSLTKIYAIPGLRLGYVLANPVIIEKIKDLQIPWSVNGMVTAILPSLLENEDYLLKSRNYVHKQLLMMRGELDHLGFYTSPSLVNFYLLKDLQTIDNEELLQFLLEHGIIPRHTYTFQGLEGNYLRLAVRKEEENAYLLEVLRSWRQQKC